MLSLVLYLTCLVLTLILICFAEHVNGGKTLARSISVKHYKIQIKKSFLIVILAFIPLWYIIAFRDMSVGKDAFGTQYRIFKYVAYGKYYDFVNYGSEAGYFWLNKICASLSNSYQLVLITTGTLSWGIFYKYIIDYSQSPHLSILLFFLSFSYFHQFNIMRQFIACAIILFGFKYIYNRKMMSYLVTILVAFLFHKIAIIAIVFYFLYDLKIDTKKGLLLVLASKLSINLARLLAGKLLYGTRYYKILYDPKAYRSGYMILEIVVAVIIYLLVMVAENNNNLENDRFFNFNLWLTILELVITVNSNSLPISYRILWYVNMNNMIFIPYILSMIKNDKKRLLVTGFIISVFILYFSYEWYTGVDAIETYSFWKS